MGLVTVSTPLPAHLQAASCGLPQAADDGWTVATPDTVGLDSDRLCSLVPRFMNWKEGIVTLATVRRGGNHSVLRQAVAATDTLHVSIACSLRNRCVEAVLRWRQMLNVL
jgi:hypothetical protein